MELFYELLSPYTIISLLLFGVGLYIMIFKKRPYYFFYCTSIFLLGLFFELFKTHPTDLINQEIIHYLISIMMMVMALFFVRNDLKTGIIKNDSYTKYLIFIFFSYTILFIIPLILTEDISFSKELFLIPQIIVPLYFSFSFFSEVKNRISSSTKKKKNLVLQSFIFTSIFIYALLELLEMNAMISTSWILTSFGFISLFYFYMIFTTKPHIVYEKMSDKEIYSKMIELDLSLQQQEATKLILKQPNATYQELSDELNIASNTFSKHASDSFRKADVSNKKEYIALFQKVTKLNS